MPAPVPPPAWRLAAIVTIAAGAVAAALLATLPSAEVWAALTPGDCAEYCEASTRCGALASRAAVQQPANTWSNLAFLFAGALVLRRPLDAFAVLFAASCALLAVGSFLFHATVTREMQWLDMVGTYAALVAVVARGFSVSFGLAPGLVLAAALVADVLFAVFKWSISANVALPLLMAAAALPMASAVMHGRRTVRDALLPFALFLGALLFRQLDVAHVACNPESRLLQGHALWHLGTAASLALLYFFFDDPRGEGAA